MSLNPVLYNYRRCPYAMRARMCLISARIQCNVIDVDFKNKPEHMLEISPKGTVPVLQTMQGDVIDESRAIIIWALSQNNPEGWFDCDKDQADMLIDENDGVFKAALDLYKYPNRFPDEDCSDAREKGLVFLTTLNERLRQYPQLMGDKVTVVDICIFPFIRQFANVDKSWFDTLDLKPLHAWLQGHLESDRFKCIMKKHERSPYLLLS